MDLVAVATEAEAEVTLDQADDANSPEEGIEAAEKAIAMWTQLGNEKKIQDAKRFLIGHTLRKYQEKEKPTEALRIVNEELAYYRERGDRRGEASMMSALADINTDKRGSKKRQEALATALEAREMFKEIGDRKMEASTLIQISNVYIKYCDKGQAGKASREAIKYATEALGVFKEIGDRKGEGTALHNIAVGKLFADSPFKDCVKIAKEALQVFRDIGCKKFEAAELHSIADWHTRKGFFKQSIPWAKEALALFKEIQMYGGWEQAALCTLLNSYIEIDNKEEAMELAKVAIDNSREKGDKLAEAQSLDMLAGIYLASEDTAEALKAAEESLAVYRELGDKRSEGYVLGTVSQVHLKDNSADDAMRSVQDSLAIAVELGDRREQARHLCHLCRMHVMKKNVAEALQYAEEAREVFAKSNDIIGEGISMLNLASVHMLEDKTDLAIAMSEEAIAIFQKEEDRRQEAMAWNFMYEIAHAMENYEAALRYACTARALFQKIGDQPQQANTLLKISQSNLSVVGSSKLGRREEKKCFDGSMKSAKEALAISKKLEDKDTGLLVLSYCQVGQVLSLVGKQKEALKAGLEGVRLAEEAPNEQRLQVNAMCIMAEIYVTGGNKAEAMKLCERATRLAETTNDGQCMQMVQQLNEMLNKKEGGTETRREAAADAGPATKVAAAGPSIGDGELGPYKGPTVDTLVPKIQELALQLVNDEELTQDTPLMDAGLDSLSMVQFRNTLQQQFPGVPMPASLIFDNPSVRAVSLNIVEELKAAHEAGRPLV